MSFLSIPSTPKISPHLRLALALIGLYQKTFSPDHGSLARPHCRYTPSCSEYAKLTLQKNGLLRGVFKSVWRILRCNPWGRGGMDLP